MVRKKNNTKPKENREFPRFILILPLEIEAGGERFRTKTKNISCAGVYCEIERYFSVGTSVSVTMQVEDDAPGRKAGRTVKCKAQVVRIEPVPSCCNKRYMIGLAFTGIADDDRDFLLRFIHQKNLKEAKELKKMYLRLKEMAAQLVEVEECHPTAEHFRKVINRAIDELDAAAHILDYEINELKSLE
jgi:PilZ domain.